jgi:N-acetyl-anhydromuramyl-L-alanine amidase AmpD
MEFNTSLRLSPDQYVDEIKKKDLIVLHHTVGGSAKSTYDYWQSDPKRIGTAFVVERDGTIFQTFPEDRWAFHVGSKLGNGIDKRSIGIEIASEGGLTENKGKLYCFGIISSRTEFKTPIYDAGLNWRGFRYFDIYDDKQLESTINLVKYLCEKYNILKKFPTDPFISDPVGYYSYKGILSHSHIRPDKTDVHPGFPWTKLND